MSLFATKYYHITLRHLCGAKQGSSFTCLSSNAVASFKSKDSFPPSRLTHPTLADGYAFTFHSKYQLFLVKNIILIIHHTVMMIFITPQHFSYTNSPHRCNGYSIVSENYLLSLHFVANTKSSLFIFLTNHQNRQRPLSTAQRGATIMQLLASVPSPYILPPPHMLQTTAITHSYPLSNITQPT